MPGFARHDAENTAAIVIQHLETLPDKPSLYAYEIQAIIESKGIRVVTKGDLYLLDRVERR